MRIEGQAITIERIEKNWLFLSISKLDGWIKVRLHRPLPNGFVLRNALLTKKADGWYITICLEDPNVPEFNPDEVTPTWDNTLGLDAVLHEDDYLATSENIKLPSLKSFRKSEKRLAKVSNRKSAKKKGTKARRKLAKREAREHQRIARARKDHAFKTAHALVRTNKKVFAHEDLNLKALSKRNKAKQDENGKYLPNGQSAKSGLNKSWNDAAFGQFFTILEYIAGKVGARTIAVKPAYTSQLLAYRDEFIFTKKREQGTGNREQKVPCSLFPVLTNFSSGFKAQFKKDVFRDRVARGKTASLFNPLLLSRGFPCSLFPVPCSL
jgi:putative transposase